MTINSKISLFVILSFFITSLCLGGVSVVTLLNNQQDSLKTAKSELLEISREMTQENANFFFSLLDKEFQRKASQSPHEILKDITQIDPVHISNIIIIDMKDKKILGGQHTPWLTSIIDQEAINDCLNNYLLNNKYDFYLDNYSQFLTDKSNSITPVAVHLKIFKDQGLMIGYGKAMETAKIRVEFMKKKNSQYFWLHILISLAIYILAPTIIVITLIYLMKISFINPLQQISFGVYSIAEGDLTTRINIDQKDEIGDLARDFNKMVDDLQKITVSRDDLVNENIARKRAEEAILKAMEDAEAANKAKGEFLANMSHEIRTPLNAILGFSDLLRLTGINEQQKIYLNTITSSSDILLSIINDILDFSKLEAGKVQLESIDFDLGNLVNDIFNMAKIRFKDPGINTYIDWDAKVPQWVKGDPTRIRQILLNFLNNAAKFTHEGEIGVIIRLEKTNAHGPIINFCVKDSGIGIPENKKHVLFESFSQVDSSTTRRYGGTGLGLAICKKLVDAMKGRVWFESQEGKGSQFFFTLPFETGTSLVQQPIEPLSKSQLMNKLVLCVDDHQASLEIVSRYCQEIGLKVIQVSSATKALLELDKLSAANTLPDLILSDVRMPDMNGYMLAEKIRSQAKFNKIKIVAVTSDARIGGAVFAQEKGFNAYLPKPVIRNDLIKIISTVLGDRRLVSAPIITRHVATEIGLKGVKVLVVDDVPSNQQLMKAYLEMFGCVTELANNGQEAIDKIKAGGSYDICLMDVQMPVMDGIEATKIIRTQISKELPIVALTAAVMKEDVERTKAAGMNGFLVKPLEINLLKSTLIKFVCS